MASLVRAVFDGPFPEKGLDVPEEEIFSETRLSLLAAVEDATQKAESRLKKFDLWGKRYVSFSVEGSSMEELKKILYQMGWREIIFYDHLKEEKRERENGWLKK